MRDSPIPEEYNKEEFDNLIDSYPLIFDATPKDGRPYEVYNLTAEFYNFMQSHKDEFGKALQDAADILRGTGAPLKVAMIRGIGHMLDLYLGAPSSDMHLLMALSMIFINQWSKLHPDMKRRMTELIE